MPCYRPLRGTRGHDGKLRPIGPGEVRPFDTMTTVSCGACIGCRIDRSRDWAVRCVHEAQTHRFNSFITLTYSDEHLPWDESVHVKHFQDFMKRLRKRIRRPVRYFHCGEYGEENLRPHYHGCIFGYDFPDKYLWSKNHRGDQYFRSDELEKLWPFGHSTIGQLNFQTAAYTARYIMKKITGPQAEEHYLTNKCDDDGVLVGRKPEYVTMSLKPGLGFEWFQKYWRDVYPQDIVIVNGKKFRPPRYYDELLERKDPDMLELVVKQREQFADQHQEDYSPRRLADREECKSAQINRLLRPL